MQTLAQKYRPTIEPRTAIQLKRVGTYRPLEFDERTRTMRRRSASCPRFVIVVVPIRWSAKYNRSLRKTERGMAQPGDLAFVQMIRKNDSLSIICSTRCDRKADSSTPTIGQVRQVMTLMHGMRPPWIHHPVEIRTHQRCSDSREMETRCCCCCCWSSHRQRIVSRITIMGE